MQNRREFLKLASTAAGAVLSLNSGVTFAAEDDLQIIRPPKLNIGDTVGLITPASPLFEAHQVIIEAREKIENLGYRVKLGKNVYKKWGYLAGTDEERLQDFHTMIKDPEVKAIIAIRGGYGSGRLLKNLDFELIKKNPKIIHGYSDITSLLIAVHQMTGLVTFHGPVAISTFTDYTKKYFYKALGQTEPIGEIEDAPFEANLQTSNRVWTIQKGTAHGRLIGGNLTLIASLMGTPYEIDTQNKILFVEEVGEEPQVLDRYLTQLDNAGKLSQCSGIIFDKMTSVHPDDYKASYYSTLSKEEIIVDRIRQYDFPACIGLSLGHIANKPTLPLGIECILDADAGKLTILESAVQ